jgi:DNA polymerase
LEKLAETLKLTNLKDSKGKSLIRKFSIPQNVGKRKGEFIEPTDEPEAFREFVEYCKQDVRTEQEIHKTLKDFELTGFPLETFLLDIEINCRGFPVNLDALRKAEKLVNEETEALAEEFRNLTGFEHTQRDRVVEWLRANGFKHDNLRADTLEEIFEDDEFDDSTPLGRALTLKKRVNYASLKKIPAMINCAGPQDNRVRGTLTYHGAGTGRWSASLVQPQNFKRPAEYLKKLTGKAYADIISGCNRKWLELVYGPPLEVVSSCIRHFIQDRGPMLDADYAAIEARIIAWQAQEKWRLDVFKTHGKIYEASASMMFNVPMSDFDAYESRGEKHPLRQKGKQAELACGFGGGVGALERMGALKNGLTKEELPDIIKYWREASPAIVTHWRTTEDAAKNAIRNPGKVYSFGVDCGFFRTKTAGMDYLFMRLPSGRKLAYPQPQLTPQLVWKEEKVTWEDGVDEAGNTIQIRKVVSSEQKKMFNPSPEQIAKVKQKYPKARMSEAITFFGQIPMKAIWGRVATYGGSLVENCVTGDNEVLTPKGWLRLDTLTDEKVWDGDEFVTHRGLINQGFQEVIDCHGVLCTPEHEFLVRGEWVRAEKACTMSSTVVASLNYECSSKSHRGKVWPYDCHWIFSLRWEKDVLEYLLQMWKHLRKGGDRNWGDRMWHWLSIFPAAYIQMSDNSWHVPSLALVGMEQYEATMQSAQPSSLSQLRRARHQGVRQMVKLFRSLFGRHGSNVEEGVGNRSSGQQRRLFPRELPVGDAQDQLPEQAQVCACLGAGSRREERGQAFYSSLALSPWGKARSSLLQEGRLSRQVYDIRNCGPRTRFVVRSPRTGLLLIAHNCTQAIAADFMAYGAINASQAGYKIVALIHDEALSEYDPLAGQSADHFVECLTKLPPWAEGMPLAAEGGSVEFYQK